LFDCAAGLHCRRPRLLRLHGPSDPTCSLLFAALPCAGSHAFALATDSRWTVTLRGFETDLPAGSELTSALGQRPGEAP